MGEQHGLGPGHAGVRIQGIDDEGLAVLPQGAGIQPQPLENHAQFRPALRQSQQVHPVLFHIFRGLALLFSGLHGFHKDAALVDFGNAAEDGRKGVAPERRWVHGQAHARVNQGFPGHALHQLEALAVQARQLRLRPGAETLRHPVQQMKTGVVQHLKYFFHPRLTCWYGTARTDPWRRGPSSAFRGSPCTACDRRPCGREQASPRAGHDRRRN